jgi:hypothetical protein
MLKRTNDCRIAPGDAGRSYLTLSRLISGVMQRHEGEEQELDSRREPATSTEKAQGAGGDGHCLLRCTISDTLT